MTLGAFGLDAGAFGVEEVLQGKDQRLGALAVDGGNLEMALDRAVGLEKGGNTRCLLFRRDQVELVQHQPARLGVKRIVILAQLFDDGFGVRDRVGLGVEGGKVDQVQQYVGALQVAQKLVS